MLYHPAKDLINFKKVKMRREKEAPACTETREKKHPVL